MYAWLIEIFGEQNALYVAYGAGALAFLLLVWVLWFWTRRVSGGVFVHGGRGRKPRLAIVDATAIDSHRRIVLVRRDDVEHLVMIGGHNDFVIERGIGTEHAAPAEEPAALPQEKPAQSREKRPREADVGTREPVRAEKAPEIKTPPPPPTPAPAPAPEPKPARTPQPTPETARPPVQPAAAPEPPQKEMPGAYAEVHEEPPMRRTVQSAPIQAAGIPAAYAEHTEPVLEEKSHEPAFDIEPKPAIEGPAHADESAPIFEDHVRASIAEAEATIAGTPANDGTLEDEMQKLLNELTRKK